MPFALNYNLAVNLVLLLGTASLFTAEITIQMDRLGAAVGPMLYGVFFEDINCAGGLHAELVQNRSFEDNPSLIAWTPLANADAVAVIKLDPSLPLNTNNPTSFQIHIKKIANGRIGVFNQGFKGISHGFNNLPKPNAAQLMASPGSPKAIGSICVHEFPPYSVTVLH